MAEMASKESRACKEVEAGHAYELGTVQFDGVATELQQTIVFMKRENGQPVHGGTTNEAVLECLIARMKYLQGKMACRENAIVITKLEESLMWLQRRTQLRVSQGVETKDEAHKS